MRKRIQSFKATSQAHIFEKTMFFLLQKVMRESLLIFYYI